MEFGSCVDYNNQNLNYRQLWCRIKIWKKTEWWKKCEVQWCLQWSLSVVKWLKIDVFYSFHSINCWQCLLVILISLPLIWLYCERNSSISRSSHNTVNTNAVEVNDSVNIEWHHSQWKHKIIVSFEFTHY